MPKTQDPGLRPLFLETCNSPVPTTMIEPIADIQTWLAGHTLSRQIDSLVLHHSYRPSAAQYQGEKTITAIRNYHLSKGWRDIGYHLLVGPDGAIWPGRDLNLPGAHALIHKPDMIRLLGSSGYLNQHSVGICAIGDYEAEKPSPTLLATLKEVLFRLAQGFQIPSERLFFHRQVTATSCPGKNFDLESVRSWLKAEPASPVVEAWAADSWRWAQTKGLILGEPTTPVDRQALATVLYRYDRLKTQG